MSDHLSRHRIEDYDSLSAERRADVLEHVRDCAGCRTAWLAEDDSRLFALLAHAPIPEHKLDQLSARIDAAIDRVEPRIRTRRLGYAAASVAASLLLAAVLGAVLWNHETPAPMLTHLDEIVVQPALEEEIAGIKLVASPDDEAQVLDLKLGETQVLMIFDESIEL